MQGVMDGSCGAPENIQNTKLPDEFLKKCQAMMNMKAYHQIYPSL